MTTRKQKKIAVINDFSGFGRCSLSVSIPIISAMKIQCCSLPTAIFSNHTGYADYFFDDYTDKMQSYYHQWENLGLEFDGIYIGFLGSEKQVSTVKDFIRRFSSNNPKIICDPVMGDNGKLYGSYTYELCRSVKELLPFSDIITPNLTEACILSDTPYNESIADKKALSEIAEKLRSAGCKSVVITGINLGENIGCFVYREKNGGKMIINKRYGIQRAGTGDVFSSIVAADTVNGASAEAAVIKAADFVKRAAALSDKFHIPAQDGICFEEILNTLM